jgi:uncharacterized protein HemY
MLDLGWRRRRARAALKEAYWQLSYGTLKQAEEAIAKALACGGDALDAGELAAARAAYTKHWTMIDVVVRDDGRR